MLTRLHIKNYALIENLDIHFHSGMNILTGATGAGKSIVINSMNLILGEKTSAEMIRSGEDEAFVEAVFEINHNFPSGIEQYLTGSNHTLLLKRYIIRGGRSHAFINDHQVTLATLKRIGNYLVDLMGQHHHQSLFDLSVHRDLLDNFSLDSPLLENYHRDFRRLKDAETELSTALKRDKLSKDRQELYLFQLKEIDNSGIQPDEEEKLKKEHTFLQHIQKISSVTQRINYEISEDDFSVLNRLKSMQKEFDTISTLDSTLQEKSIQWNDIVFSLEDMAFELTRYSDSLQADPARLEWVEERLRLYSDLKKKYGGDYDTIMNYRDNIEQEIKSIETSELRIEELNAEIRKLKSIVLKSGDKLSQERKSGGAILKDKIEEELAELGMSGTCFSIQYTPVQSTKTTSNISTDNIPIYAGEFGLEDVEFLISPNLGEPLKPLVKIASGGEISRIMLALKSVLARVDKIPLLVLDEIDVGIGGGIASKVGEKLQSLSKNHQIICITHLQQIAAYADAHFLVLKSKKGNRTVTEVTKLSKEEQVEEIARMIGGREITKITLEHAKEFLASTDI